MGEAFFTLDGDLAIASEHTRGPWDPAAQHAGPPAALLGRAIERCEPREGFLVARVTFDILRPVPIAPLRVAARVVRPGRNVDLVEATLENEAGHEIMRASAWRMRANTAPGSVHRDGVTPAGPDEGIAFTPEPWSATVGYHTAMDWRFVEGAMTRPGPATSWFRMRIPLIEGEQPSPLTRVLAAADSGNGISNVLDFRSHVFINTDLTVHLTRPAAGEWICLRAETTIERGGAGLASSVIYDTVGAIGSAAQTLYVTTR